MNIMIVGAGKVGAQLTRQLAGEGHNVTVVDTNPEIVDNIINIYDVIGVCGSGAIYDIQKEADAGNMDLMIATSPSDEINILACQVAKKLGVTHTIARVRNPEYEKQLRFMREDLGLTMSINPEKSVAHEISRVLRFPSAVKLETFSRGRMDLVQYKINEKDGLDGIALARLGIEKNVRVLICAVSRGDDTFIPGGDYVLKNDDTIYVTASPKNLEDFFRRLGVYRRRAHSVMIVGASKMSYYLASELLSMGMAVKIIDINETRCDWMSEMLPKALVIHGDGTDIELLREENIESADAFVALTGLDEANILMCLSATTMAECKCVAKINRPALSDFVAKRNMIDSIVSTGSIVTEKILQYIRGMQNASGTRIRALHRIADNRAEALEFAVPHDFEFAGKPLADLNIKSGVLVAGIVRTDGSIVIPTGADMLCVDDDVIIVTTDTSLRDLRDIFTN